MLVYQPGTELTLEHDGVHVIEDVISPEMIAALREQMWTYLNHLTKHTQRPIIKDQPNTYRSFFELLPKHGMLLQHWNVGHNPMSWVIRQHPCVIEAFYDIWDTSDLLTSFDGLSISLPCEQTGRGWYRGTSWWHTDQSYRRNEFECVQGLVNLYDVEPGDATLRVLRGSHQYHGECRERFDIQDKPDWYKLSDTQLEFYKDEKKCQDICLSARAGSLMLWDSRTIHQGVEPQRDRARENIRCALYVCMTPRSRSTAAQLKKKRKAFQDRRTTSHYPNNIRLFPVNPRTYGHAIPQVDDYPIVETPLMRRLGGY